jgi:hypothetical protein
VNPVGGFPLAEVSVDKVIVGMRTGTKEIHKGVRFRRSDRSRLEAADDGTK